MDYEDFENMEYEDFKGLMEKQNKYAQRYQAEQAAKEQGQILRDALTDIGLDENSFNQIASKNPQETKKIFKEHVKSYVKTVAKNRDEKGRFVKETTPRHTESASEMGLGRRFKGAKPQKRFDPKASRGTDEDMTNMVLDALGDDPLFSMD